MADTTDRIGEATGIAALALCESLLLALADLNVLAPHEAQGVLHDAAGPHRRAPGTAEEQRVHTEVVRLIEQIAAGANPRSRP